MERKNSIYKLGFLIQVVCLGLLFACQNGVNENASLGDASAQEVMIANEPAPAVPIERKLIKEGHISFETNDLTETAKRIQQAVKKYKAYISSETENNYAESLSRTVIIRMEAAQFDAFIRDATFGVNKFETKNIQVKDVTEEFVDVQARLKTKKELEQRYLLLLKKADKISEILEIEKQLGELRGEIESVEGRLRYLDNQSVYSTLSITYYKTTPKQVAFGPKFQQGFSNGWQNFTWFMVGLINIWPFLLLLLVFVFLVRRWWHNRNVRKRAQISFKKQAD